jgi:glyoxylase-like metal-dependent hydrolase (beta-lactamase superfamily II)
MNLFNGTNSAVSVELFHSGYCLSNARVVNPGASPGKMKFYAVWLLIYHESTGYMLFDTGYTERFYAVTKKFPERFYRIVTPVFIRETDTVSVTLEKKGIPKDKIKYIVISHFHADHIGALLDFPNAAYLCSRTAYEQVRAVKGMKAVIKGILKGLIPIDFEKRVIFIEDIAEKGADKSSGLWFYCFPGVDQLKFFLLPGHAKGMLGLYIESGEKRFFYASDAAWNKDAFMGGILPRKIVSLFFDSWKEYTETQEKIRIFLLEHPDVNILFTHCPKTLDYISSDVQD